MKPITVFILGILIILSVSACTEVRAWERGYLAQPEMAWKPDPLESALNDHIFFSKEASSGGNSAAGGGCGCN
ncbi:MAG: DUF4266 domain-containing protein [Gammaproteobacteria bacterium]|jgi:hypothetical protein|nr:DUF4266 domain-containing protein [Gammaproteobacteria bacterium]MBT3858939.1 DUF4266 domain-containing protein [Gammaproteobacteria bacterium]MBT3988267.1 DUF4266 domain-containing protein [Gammaproteobacteria bacterium]MBT4257273.1 DUF4266 domain-containing protein [Gammaproteobacteria bacterium]MBT4582537.1 DUF4266 domain-containing protein [Gammaproteobacteria bacterium]